MYKSRFVRFFVSICFTLNVTAASTITSAASDPPNIATEALNALHSIVTKGFFRGSNDEYDSAVSVLEELDNRDFQKKPLTEQEAKKLSSLIAGFRSETDRWIKRLVEKAKKLQTDGIVKFPAGDWQTLQRECRDIASKGDKAPALDAFETAIKDLKNGNKPEFGDISQGVKKEIEGCLFFLKQFHKAAFEKYARLSKSIAALERKINENKSKCAKLKGEARKKCDAETNQIISDWENQKEQRERIEEFTTEAEKGSKLLAALLMIVGVALGAVGGIYGCGECVVIGAKMAAAGGAMWNDADKMEKGRRSVTDNVSTGLRERVFKNAKGATPKERAELLKRLKENGFEPIPVNHKKVKDGVAYEIVASKGEIRLFLVKGNQLLASVKHDNTELVPNKKEVRSPFQITGLKLVSAPFAERNLVRLNLIGKSPNGKEIKFVISEVEGGAKQNFVMTIK